MVETTVKLSLEGKNYRINIYETNPDNLVIKIIHKKLSNFIKVIEIGRMDFFELLYENNLLPIPHLMAFQKI